MGSKDSSAQPREQNEENILCVRPESAKDLTELKHTGAGENTRRRYKLWCTESEHSKGKRGYQQKTGEAGERGIPWCFQIIFNSARQRNHCRNVSPVLHLKAKMINKRFSNKGYKKESLPSHGRAEATALGASGADPGKSLSCNCCLGQSLEATAGSRINSGETN